MMAAAGSAPLSETTRERETFRYDSLEISTVGLASKQPPKSISSSVLSLAPDPGLTAFAQLGLHRLKAGRVLISLFDRSYQHIVAEALRVPPTGPNDEPVQEGEQVWFNGLTFPRVTSVCEHVVTGIATSQYIPGNEHGTRPTDLPVSIIHSLDGDPRFCHIQDKNRQFYVGVPIRSPAAINIGVYCAFDDKPRPDGLSPDDVQFVRDISCIVMDYLEAKKSHEWYRREERMVRGLGRFVDGQGSMANSPDSASRASFRDIPGAAEGSLNKNLSQPPLGARPRVHVRDLKAADSVVVAHPSTSQRQRTPPTPVKSHISAADQLRADVDRVFSRAANVIRESIDIEGVLFLDARIRSYGGLVGKDPSAPLAPARPSSSESSGDEKSHAQPDQPGESVCKVLGFSTSQGSSLSGDAPPSDYASLPEAHLQRLLQRCSHGRIFNFESDGSVSDNSSSDGDDASARPRRSNKGARTTNNEDPTATDKPKKPRPRVGTASSIIKMFPGARSVIVVPLWDAHRNRWFAGALAWTRTPTRIFAAENELSFLKVFGLATTAEVARLMTKAADKTKTDILGSISHELRSPLHGVVGAVELLRHTILDTFQESILGTIESSGRTLLDAINHLLDYSKLNKMLQSPTTARKGSAHDPKLKSESVLPPNLGTPKPSIQLDLLVEEVIESLLAGSRYQIMPESQLPPSNFSILNFQPKVDTLTVNQLPDGLPSSSRRGVQIYLDIDPSASWSFRIDPGAFRRIIMELFGNSLKFTRTGFIRLSLRNEVPPHGEVGSANRVVFIVSDSGNGIGEDFLRNHLYTPFSQEDHFTPGTGLGLGLVRQVILSLGGTIDLSSHVGQGTTISVSLPLSPSDETPEENKSYGDNINALARLRVLLRGFESTPEVREGFSAEDAKEKSPLQLMESICRDWLKMDTMSEISSDSPLADFVICNTDHMSAVADAVNLQHNPRCPHIFICQGWNIAHGLSRRLQSLHVPTTAYRILLQPTGPQNLAKTLLDTRLRVLEAQNSITESQDLKDPISAQDPKPEISEPEMDDMTLRLAESSLPTSTLEAPLPTSRDVKEATSSSSSLPPLGSIVTTQDDTAPIQAEACDPPASILIVDDNPINLRILSAYMAKLGHSHAIATNGLEALEIFTNAPSRYSCVLTDISMPVMDGLESTRRIREFERAQSLQPIVVIALTGLIGADVRQDALSSGVDLFLTRPLILKGLEEALTSVGLR